MMQRDDLTTAEAAAELDLTEPELISLVRRVGPPGVIRLAPDTFLVPRQALPQLRAEAP